MEEARAKPEDAMIRRNQMELEDFKGIKTLTGVDFSKDGDASVCRFELDGVVYSVAEDPCDGYRSTAKDVAVGGDLQNRFPGHKVFCMHVGDQFSCECGILELVDVETSKVVLSVGTDSTDNYYPFYVAEFSPENLKINQREEQK